jgi:hypothetical protein
MAGQARSSRFVTRASRDKPSSGSTEKEAVIQDGSLEGPLDGQDENGEKQTTADDPDAIHIPKWLRTNNKTVKAVDTSIEWRDACKEYEAFPRELKMPQFPKFPQLRLKNTEHKLILKTLGRAESRGEVPYESELDDAEREEVYEDVRQDLKNIRESVKEAKRLRGDRNGDRTLFESIDWQEDQFELSSGMFWGHESDEDDEEEESAEEDAVNEEKLSEEKFSSKEAEALVAGSGPAEQAEVDEEMGEADDNEQEEKVVEENGEKKEEKSEEQPSSKETEALVVGSELAKQVEVDKGMGEADDVKADGSSYVAGNFNSEVQGQDGHEPVADEGTAAPVAGNESAKQVDADEEMGEADDDKPDGSLYVAENVNSEKAGSESAKQVDVDEEMGEADDNEPDGLLNVAGNVNSLVQEPHGHELVADEGAATVNSLVGKENGHELVADEDAATAGNVDSSVQKRDGHESVANEEATTAGNVNSLKQEQDGHAFVADEHVATTAS